MPDASARAFDEARELFLSQLKIVSYHLNVRPIAKRYQTRLRNLRKQIVSAFDRRRVVNVKKVPNAPV